MTTKEQYRRAWQYARWLESREDISQRTTEWEKPDSVLSIDPYLLGLAIQQLVIREQVEWREWCLNRPFWMRRIGLGHAKAVSETAKRLGVDFVLSPYYYQEYLAARHDKISFI